MRTDISAVDRIGNGIVAGFIATVAMSVLHEAVEFLTEAVGAPNPALGWVFHFFVGTLLWGGAFGLAHDYLPGASWLRGTIFGGLVALIVLLGVMPLVGAGMLGLEFDTFAPLFIVIAHLVYGTVLGVAYGKLTDTDEAHENEAAAR